VNRNNLKGHLIFFILILLTAPLSALAFQERSREAILIGYKGEVKIQREGKEGLEKTSNNLPLYGGDLIITQEHSWAQLSLAEGGTVILHANSRAYLNNHLEGEGAVTSLVLIEGCLSAKIAPQAAETSLIVETALLTATAQGTSFSMGVGVDGTTRIGVEAGKVMLEEADGGLTLKENQEISLETPPSAFTKEEPLGDKNSKLVLQEYKQRSREDWEVWHKKIIERFFQNPVGLSQKMAEYLEAAVAQEREMLKQIDRESNQLQLLLEATYKVRKKKDLETLSQKQKELGVSLLAFQRAVLEMRRLNNKLTALFELGQGLGRKLPDAKERLADDWVAVKTNLKRIKHSTPKVKLAQQAARRIIKERLPRLYQQSKELMTEK
jgi:hypothetical protein